MTVVITQGQHNGANAGQQYYYEDTRPGHNIGYLGDGRMPVNSITFTPIFGPYPNDHKTTAGAIQSYSGAHYSPEYVTAGNGTLVHGSWMRLGNPKIPTVSHFSTGRDVADTMDYFGNVLPYNWISCVPDEQPMYMTVGTDAGADKNVHIQNNFGGLGEGYYGYYQNTVMNDGDELFSKLPNYSTANSNAAGYGIGFAHSYKTGGSASYRGFHEIAYVSGGSYHTFLPYINFRRNTTSTTGRYQSWGNYRNISYLGTYGGYPYYLEISLGQNGMEVSAHSYDVDGNTMTEVFNGDIGAGSAVDYASTSYDGGTQGVQHNSGTSDGYWKGPTKWMLSQGGAYRWLMFPCFTTADFPVHNMVRMDTSSNAIQYSGYTASTSQPAMYGYNGGNIQQYAFNGVGMNPGDLGGSQATSKQPGIAAAMFEWHGGYDVNTGEKFGPDHTGAACTAGSGKINQLYSLFPSYGVQGRADGDSNARHRRIYTFMFQDPPTNWTSGYSNYTFWKGFTTVPETPHNWAWLDEKRTLIAAICNNNTYIYECRGYDFPTTAANYAGQRYNYYIGNTNSTGADAFNATLIPSYNSRGTPHTFNMNPTSQTSVGGWTGWVHVNTIPHRVVQMGIDKHGKIFAITANITATGGTNGYGGNMHMWTENTPFSVALAGDITTDTITHSGSNIDKTLTIETLGIRGRNLKTKVQMEIVGTDAQFDNGTQSKEVTTSTSGTVSETVTITGSSQFNIVANFGV